MNRFMMYNGKTAAPFFSNSPQFLKKNTIYEVIDVNVLTNQTNLRLKGKKGEFCSDWFVEVPIYLGVCHQEPSPSKDLYLEIVKGSAFQTPPVVSVEYLGSNVYQVVTIDSVYIVEKK